MTEIAQAHPLQWPLGWPRTPSGKRKRALFVKRSGSNGTPSTLELGDGVSRVFKELNAMGIKDDAIVVSSMCRPQLGGRGSMTSEDPGAAVYWTHGKATRCMAIDQYTRLPDNLAAIAATIEAMRQIERHGGAEILDRAFTGFTALAHLDSWFEVLGVKSDATRQQITDAHRRKASAHHPDKPDGSEEMMAKINQARDDGLAQAKG